VSRSIFIEDPKFTNAARSEVPTALVARFAIDSSDGAGRRLSRSKIGERSDPSDWI
jgi:hypothetical protein